MVQTSSSFRRITSHEREERADDLFRAAIDSFASVQRPSLDEIRTLEVLTEALYERIGPEVKRYSAATLSGLGRAPHSLLLRLSKESAQIAAPILLRSTLLTSRDLLHILEKTGADHAEIVSHRANLPANVSHHLAKFLHGSGQPNETVAAPKRRSGKLDLHKARDHLRRAMAANHEIEPAPNEMREPAEPVAILGWQNNPIDRLRATALSGDRAVFVEALARALGIDTAIAEDITCADGSHQMLIALRSLGIGVSDAFLICSASRPDTVRTAARIRLFVQRYENLSEELARDRLANWRDASSEPARLPQAGNDGRSDEPMHKIAC